MRTPITTLERRINGFVLTRWPRRRVLTDEQVREIRATKRTAARVKRFANRFGVTAETIRKIYTGERHKGVA